jgi:hypothetical protein
VRKKLKSDYDNKTKLILLNFLKSGLSTRQLDLHLGLDNKKSKGWESWNKLNNQFFCLSRRINEQDTFVAVV